MNQQQTRSGATSLLAMTAAVVVMALAVLLAAVLISSSGDNDAVGATAAGEVKTVEIELGNLYVKPKVSGRGRARSRRPPPSPPGRPATSVRGDRRW